MEHAINKVTAVKKRMLQAHITGINEIKQKKTKSGRKHGNIISNKKAEREIETAKKSVSEFIRGKDRINKTEHRQQKPGSRSNSSSGKEIIRNKERAQIQLTEARINKKTTNSITKIENIRKR